MKKFEKITNLINEYNSIIKDNNLFEDMKGILSEVKHSNANNLKGTASGELSKQMKDIVSDFRNMSYEHKLDSGYTESAAKGIPRIYQIHKELIQSVLNVKFGDTIEIDYQGGKLQYLLTDSNTTNHCLYSEIGNSSGRVSFYARGYRYNKTKKVGAVESVINIVIQLENNEVIIKSIYIV
jgi:hypothetical protein